MLQSRGSGFESSAFLSSLIFFIVLLKFTEKDVFASEGNLRVVSAYVHTVSFKFLQSIVNCVVFAL